MNRNPRDMPTDQTYSLWEINLAFEALETFRDIHDAHFSGYMGEKRKNMVIKYGYDVKNAAHLIRLMTMCNEFLTLGAMRVFRTDDAQYFKAMKSGAFPLSHIKEEAHRLFNVAEDLLGRSFLPEQPALDEIDLLVREIHRRAYEFSPLD